MMAIFVSLLLAFAPLMVAALGGSLLWVVATGIVAIAMILGILAWVNAT